ncbi:hypothetical protein BDR04DRAFT_1103840 [Suillus decipiens]|nr:hypothetical protein BDR04DRAFT_1103840 [Suillus decipiens]
MSLVLCLSCNLNFCLASFRYSVPRVDCWSYVQCNCSADAYGRGPDQLPTCSCQAVEPTNAICPNNLNKPMCSQGVCGDETKEAETTTNESEAAACWNKLKECLDQL